MSGISARRHSSWMDEWRVDVPEGERGRWRVERFTVGEKDQAVQFGSLFSSGRIVPPGVYTRLTRSGAVVMSDTPDEIRDHLSLRRVAADERVLVHGLGLGMAVGYLLRREERVASVDVVEVDADVIALTGPHYEKMAADVGVELTIWHGDAFSFRFPDHASRRWDAAWHDVWDDLCADNLEEMSRLHRRYCRKVGWQESWGRGFLRSRRSRGWW